MGPKFSGSVLGSSFQYFSLTRVQSKQYLGSEPFRDRCSVQILMKYWFCIGGSENSSSLEKKNLLLFLSLSQCLTLEQCIKSQILPLLCVMSVRIVLCISHSNIHLLIYSLECEERSPRDRASMGRRSVHICCQITAECFTQWYDRRWVIRPYLALIPAERWRLDRVLFHRGIEWGGIFLWAEYKQYPSLSVLCTLHIMYPALYKKDSSNWIRSKWN